MLIDSHCHLDFEEFDIDRGQVLRDAGAGGVGGVVIPAVTQASWQRTLSISREHNLGVALGLHPVFVEQHQPHHLIELDALIADEKPLAVGEIGLDFFLKELDANKQLAYFNKQLIIAKQHHLPVIIHCRKAHDQVLSSLREHQPAGGIIHAFNGSIQQAEKYIELGFLLGFGGMLTYTRSSKLRKLAEQIPLESIALETDAPDMVVAQHRGKRNSPVFLPLIAQALADVKQLSLQQVASTTTDNILRCLSYPSPAS